MGSRVQAGIRGTLGLLTGLALAASTPTEMGPPPTRELFPLYLISLPYQPADPTPLGRGRWRVELVHWQANTFEFSDIFKTLTPRDAEGRVRITRDYVLQHASEYAQIPLVYFFDEENARTSLRFRRGLDDRTDLWGELTFESHNGGYLDGLIEGFHKVGFEQYGRDRVERNRITLVVMERGKLVFFSDSPVRGKTRDPVLGLTRLLYRDPAWTLSLALAIKPPLTRAYDVYQSGWDQAYSLSARWQPLPRHLLYAGGGYVRRPRGSEAYNSFPEGNFRDGLGGHLGWEYRSSSRWRPFFQLYAQSGYLHPQPFQKLDRWSLQHDAGIHWQLGVRSVLSLHYLNNITHNENTADMALGLRLTTAF